MHSLQPLQPYSRHYTSRQQFLTLAEHAVEQAILVRAGCLRRTTIEAIIPN